MVEEMTMPRTDTSKIRLLAVEQMVRRGKQITVSQIQQELELKYGIKAENKTIRSDLQAIDRFVPLEIKQGYGGGYRMVDVLGRCED
jgi:predicted DNA-binding transcriptional regulator YafY